MSLGTRFGWELRECQLYKKRIKTKEGEERRKERNINKKGRPGKEGERERKYYLDLLEGLRFVCIATLTHVHLILSIAL